MVHEFACKIKYGTRFGGGNGVIWWVFGAQEGSFCAGELLFLAF